MRLNTIIPPISFVPKAAIILGGPVLVVTGRYNIVGGWWLAINDLDDLFVLIAV